VATPDTLTTLFALKADLKDTAEIDQHIMDNGGFAKLLHFSISVYLGVCYIVVVMKA